MFDSLPDPAPRRAAGTGRAHLVVADGHPLILDAFRVLFLRHDPTVTVVGFGEVSALEVALTGGIVADLVLLDFALWRLSCIGAVVEFLGRHPDRRIGIIAGNVDATLASDLIRIGCVGVIPKTLSPNGVYHAVRLMMGGSRYLPECLGEAPTRGPVAVASARADPILSSDHRKSGLTRREVEVLRSLATGQTNKQIARALEIEEVTVKLHLRHGYTKLDVRNRIGAARAVLDGALD